MENYKDKKTITLLKIYIILFIICLVIMGSIYYYRLYDFKGHQERSYQNHNDLLIRNIANSIAMPLFEYDQATINKLLYGYITNDQTLQCIYLKEHFTDFTIGLISKNNIILPLDVHPDIYFKNEKKHNHVKRNVQYNGKIIAELILYFSLEKYDNDLKNFKLNTIILLILISAIILLAVYFLIKLYLFLYDQLDRERKKLRESEKKFRSYIESSPNGIFVINRAGRFLNVNRAFQITGYSRQELLVMFFNSLIYKDDRQIFEDHIKIVSIREHTSCELRYLTKNGSVCYWVVDITKLAEDEYLGFTKDITKNKEMEMHLRQSEKMQAIGQLAGGIAHDFNNQLTGILGYADLLKNELEDEQELIKYVDNIITGVKRSSDLTYKLLAFSHKGMYLSVDVDMHQIISEVFNILNRTVNKKIRLVEELSADQSVIKGDPTQLQNAILNIALNARDSMPDGGVITFTTACQSLDEKSCQELSLKLNPDIYLVIEIADTGTGMSDETKQRIFEPFFTTKEPGKGSGMGLAAVYGTIKNHKGAITVWTKKNLGTTFKVYLPLAEIDDLNTSRNESDHIEINSIKIDAHILVVEDEKSIREMTAVLLKQLGYKVTMCKNGKEAVAFYKKHWQSIDLVILDMIMPELDGKQTFLLMLDINPEITAIISSGYSLDNEIQAILDSGVKGFIQKPYRVQKLHREITKLLQNKDI